MEYICFLISAHLLEKSTGTRVVPEAWFQWNFQGFQRITVVEEMTLEAVLQWGKQLANAEQMDLRFATPLLILDADEDGLPEKDWEDHDPELSNQFFLEDLSVLYLSQHTGLSPEIVEAEMQVLSDLSKPDAGYLLSYQSHSRLVKAGHTPKMPQLLGCQEFNTVYADAARRWRSKNQC